MLFPRYMLSRHWSLLIGVGLVSVVSCSWVGSLSRSRVEDTLREASDFTAPKTVIFVTGKNVQVTLYDPEYPALKSLGWIDIRGPLKIDGLSAKGLDILLTDKGISESRSWKREETSNGVFWTMPIANRKLKEIIGIGPSENKKAEVEFSWSWIPNRAGEAIATAVDSLTKMRDAYIKEDERAYQEKLERAHVDTLVRLQADMFHQQRAQQEVRLFSLLARSKKIDQSKVFKAVVTFYRYDDGWHPSSKADEDLKQALKKSEK